MSGKYTPPLEFTLIAHNVVTGEHAETGAVVASLTTDCRFWASFPNTRSEPFCHEMWPFNIDLSDIVVGDEYVHGRFHVSDGNKYAVTPSLEFAAYIGEKYTNVISYVQWNEIVTLHAPYLFGVRIRKQLKQAITREYSGLRLVRKGLG